MIFNICINNYWGKRKYFHITKSNQLQRLLPGDLRHKSSTAAECCAINSKLTEITWKERNVQQQQQQQQQHQNGQYIINSTASKTPNVMKVKRLMLLLDGMDAFYFVREILNFTEFRYRLCTNPTLRLLNLLWIEIGPAKKEIIDYKWNLMVTETLYERIELEIMISWLSTLGGGFSALGEQFGRCAKTAGNISMKQLSLGLRLGDPFFQVRCKLYFSLSLIQTGRLRYAKYILREQHKFALKHQAEDVRLYKMWQAIWMRLEYEYVALRAKQKKNNNKKKI